MQSQRQQQQQHQHQSTRPANQWVPSLYFAQGLPFFVVTLLSTVMYKTLAVSNTLIVIAVSCFFFPWIMKPFLALLVEGVSVKRRWAVTMEFLIGLGLMALALSLAADSFFVSSVVLFLSVGCFSALHDISSDGYYLIALSLPDQYRCVGHRNCFYQLAQFTCHGGLIALAGWLALTWSVTIAWQMVLLIAATVMIIISMWHAWQLPQVESGTTGSSRLAKLWPIQQDIIREWFSLKQKGLFLLFVLLFNGADAQLGRIVPLFFLDDTAQHGLALSTVQVSHVLAVGVVALIGGAFLLSRCLRSWSLYVVIRWASVAMIVSHVGYLLLVFKPIASLLGVMVIHAIAQAIFGFGNSAYMALLMKETGGKNYPAAFFALMTALMSLCFLVFGLSEAVLQVWLPFSMLFLFAGLFSIGIAALTWRVTTSARWL